ncbi:MAG: hypothetical protein HYR51_05820 [Candidatus Rokubacteria bacterium]|nr:hypothetical protein [Candidatus Rokubacteria bacterium]
MKTPIVVAVSLGMLAGLATVAVGGEPGFRGRGGGISLHSGGGFRGHGHFGRGRHFHGFRHFTGVIVLAPPVVYSAPAVGYASPPPVVYAPPVYYSAPMYVPPPAPAPPPAPRVVEYATGRYELRGDGVTTPYTWVWIPNPPPPPPPPPPAAPPVEAPGSGAAPPRVGNTQLYRWVDSDGVAHWTDRLDAVPERHRRDAKRSGSS